MNSYHDLLNNLHRREPRKLNDHILLIDGLNTLIRSFVLIKAMNPAGHHVGGLVGFLRSVGYIIRFFDPTRVIIVWDGKGGGVTRRNIDPEYKAQRGTTKITNWGMYDTKEEELEALSAQVRRAQDYLNCLPVHQITLEKIEADDILAFLALSASKQKKKATIVSSDKDFLQLIDDNIKVYAPTKKVLYTRERVKEELGLLPENYNIAKVFLGDTSDNVKKIKGVGLKTLIKEFPLLSSSSDINLDYIYNLCEKHLGERKVFEKIINQWDRVEKNYELMNLHKSILTDREKQEIIDELKTQVPELRKGVFLYLLDQDKIEGIVKNTEGWLDQFASLTVYKEEK